MHERVDLCADSSYNSTMHTIHERSSRSLSTNVPVYLLKSTHR